MRHAPLTESLVTAVGEARDRVVGGLRRGRDATRCCRGAHDLHARIPIGLLRLPSLAHGDGSGRRRLERIGSGVDRIRRASRNRWRFSTHSRRRLLICGAGSSVIRTRLSGRHGPWRHCTCRARLHLRGAHTGRWGFERISLRCRSRGYGRLAGCSQRRTSGRRDTRRLLWRHRVRGIARSFRSSRDSRIARRLRRNGGCRIARRPRRRRIRRVARRLRRHRDTRISRCLSLSHRRDTLGLRRRGLIARRIERCRRRSRRMLGCRSIAGGPAPCHRRLGCRAGGGRAGCSPGVRGERGHAL